MGTGVEKSPTRALELYLKACDRGDAPSCGNASVSYGAGSGTAKDVTKALKYGVKACDGKSANGCTTVAVIYDLGDGVPKDDARAGEFYLKACSLNDMDACQRRATFHLEGRGGRKDDAAAFSLYEKACAAKLVSSCFALGMHYRTGRGVAQNREKGDQLIREACQAGFQQACGVGAAVPTQSSCAKLLQCHDDCARDPSDIDGTVACSKKCTESADAATNKLLSAYRACQEQHCGINQLKYTDAEKMEMDSKKARAIWRQKDRECMKASCAAQVAACGGP